MKSWSAAVITRQPWRDMACGSVTEGDTENLRNRPHCLPLEIQVYNLFIWVERVRANYGDLRGGFMAWSSSVAAPTLR